MSAPAHERGDLRGHEGDDRRLVLALRSGDEAAFLTVLDRYHGPLLRFATIYLPAPEARSLVQDLWLALIDALDRCEGKEAFRVWLYRLLLDRIRERVSSRRGLLRRLGVGRRRSVPHARMWSPALMPAVAAVEPGRFLPEDHEDAGSWATPPVTWRATPDTTARIREHLLRAVESLPPAEREVVTLRDIEGWDAGEVCNFLGVTETKQRILLHRGRSAVRRALEQHLAEQNHYG